jgi:hypothetical protein
MWNESGTIFRRRQNHRRIFRPISFWRGSSRHATTSTSTTKRTIASVSDFRLGHREICLSG